MKNLFLVLGFTLFFICSKGQNIGIGTNTPHASAALDITDSSKGILIPRMTMAQRNGIQNPAVGLMVYQTDSLTGFWSFDGMKWKPILDLEGDNNGEMLYWNNGQWVKVAPGAQGQTLTFCNGKPHWGACPVNPFYFGNGVTDIDGNSYDTVKICNQVWMKQNLNVSRYRNGDIIPQVTDPTQWAGLTTGAWCYYNNDSTNGAVYGKLYNWYAVNDPRGLAPEGWHVPSDGEWNRLVKCLDANADTSVIGWLNTNIGGSLKSLDNWINPNIGATNSSGFSGLPGGDHDINGTFYSIGNEGFYWSSTEVGTTQALYRGIYNYTSDFYKNADFNVKSFGFSVRCVKDIIATLPTLSTNSISSITTSAATCGGNITNDGGGNITARGVCWSTSSNPTADLTTKTTDGSGTGSYTSSITGLLLNTTYYVRAYATNSAGTAYGNEISFITQTINNNTGVGVTDIDGNTYDTVRICNQTWTKKNLNVSRYRNGDIIPQVTDPTQWAGLTTGAWCYYNNDSANGEVYGKLYNWYAVNDPRGLAPEGWHVPSDGEWTTLTDCLGGESVAGGKMREIGTAHWYSTNSGVNNSSGFNALGSGYRSNSAFFENLTANSIWWSKSKFNDNYSWYRNIYWETNSVNRFANYSNNFGFSVRCVKDESPSTIDSGLVAYYPFNGNANDESGNGNNGTVNEATLTTDRFGNAGKAYGFDGVNDYIHLNNFSLNNQKLTISSWIKVENYFFNSPNQQQSIYYLGTEAGGENPQTNTIDFTIDGINYNPPFLRTNLNYSYGFCGIQTSNTEWLNNITVFDGTNQVIKFYINGILINSCNVTPNAINISSNDINNIGCGWSSNSNIVNNFFKGNIDDIRIYNRALTQEEITYLAGH